MSNKDNETNKLIFTRSSTQQSEFKLFTLIEDTITGLLGFIERFIRTIILVAFMPSKLVKYVNIPYQNSVLVRPFTFLALSSFLTSIYLRFGLPFIGDLDKLRGVLENISTLSVIKNTIPVLFTVVLISLFTSHLLTRKNNENRKKTIHLICYSIGLQFLIFSIMSFFSIQQSWHIQNEALEIFIIILSWILVILVMIIPKKILWRNTKLISSNSRLNNIVLSLISITFSIFIFFSASISAFYYDKVFNWSIIDRNSSEPKIVAWNSEIDYKDELMIVTLIIKNNSNRPIYVKKSSNDFSFWYWEKCPENSYCERQSEYVNTKYFIQNWEDGDKPIMVVEKKESKWIQISINLGTNDEFLNDSDAYPIKASNTYFTIIDPISKEFSLLSRSDQELKYERKIRCPINGILIDSPILNK